MEALRPLGVVQVWRSITAFLPVFRNETALGSLADSGRLSVSASVAGNQGSVDGEIAGDRELRCSPPAADVRDIDVDRGLAAVALHLERHRLSDPDPFELLGQVGEPTHRPAVHADDDVARLATLRVHAAQAGALG